MPRTGSFATVIVALALLIAPARTRADIQYGFTDLGTLGGLYSYATGVNSAGQVVGSSTLANGSQNAFLWQNGAMTNLGTFGSGPNSLGLAINSLGQVAGWSNNVAGGYGERPFIATNGVKVDLGTLPSGTGAEANALNNAGVAVGDSLYGGSTTQPPMARHATLFANGKVTDLGTLGGTDSQAYGINTAGQIVGHSQIAGDTAYHAFTYANGKMTDLGTLGGSSSGAAAINDLGQIVGDSTLAGSAASNAFSYSNGRMTDLGTLGGTYSDAYAVNNFGVIVGGSSVSTNDPTSHAFIDVAGVMSDLNSITALPTGWTLMLASGISDNGYIVGTAIDPSGHGHAYLLTPVLNSQPSGGVIAPEPSSLALLAVGAVGFAQILRKARRHRTAR